MARRSTDDIRGWMIVRSKVSHVARSRSIRSSAYCDISLAVWQSRSCIRAKKSLRRLMVRSCRCFNSVGTLLRSDKKTNLEGVPRLRRVGVSYAMLGTEDIVVFLVLPLLSFLLFRTTSTASSGVNGVPGVWSDRNGLLLLLLLLLARGTALLLWEEDRWGRVGADAFPRATSSAGAAARVFLPPAVLCLFFFAGCCGCF
mmetsp:Transcript_14444/g.29993  ORF Transcript_14444/g.29993 Transcript_14444/m.29993 type:complete len:200 (+) Transcript_14444:733-1332(+)